MPEEKDFPAAPANGLRTNDEELRVIGIPRRRVDARAKVTGQTRFADDIFLAPNGALQTLALAASPCAHSEN